MLENQPLQGALAPVTGDSVQKEFVLKQDGSSNLLSQQKLRDRIFKKVKQLELSKENNLSMTTDAKGFYECSECPSTFKLASELTKHKGTHNNSNITFKPVWCKLCKIMLTTTDEAALHAKKHAKRFQCDQCGMTFVQKNNFTAHLRRHTGEKPFKCSMCSLSFRQMPHLTAHKRRHTLDKPFSCKICGARFIQNSNLKRHTRIHTGEKPFSCHLCTAAFSDKRNLTRHLMTHAGIKPFQCLLCPAKFTQKTDLQRHSLGHAEIKPFKCTHCNASFTRLNNLRWHQLTHGGQAAQEKCPTCSVCFSNRRDLKQHLKTHDKVKSFSCKTCNVVMSCQASFTRHVKSHNLAKPYLCSSCPASFQLKNRLKRHELRHKGVRAHKCTLCDKTFCDKMTLTRHRVVVHGEERFPPSLNDENKDIGEEILSLTATSAANTSVYTETESLQSLSSSLVNTVSSNVRDSISVQAAEIDESVHMRPAATLAVNNMDVIQSDPVSFVESSEVDCKLLPAADGQLLVLTQCGETKTYRLAGNCPNHQNHLFTFYEGNSNQFQPWCACDVMNTSVSLPSIVESNNAQTAEVSRESSTDNCHVLVEHNQTFDPCHNPCQVDYVSQSFDSMAAISPCRNSGNPGTSVVDPNRNTVQVCRDNSICHETVDSTQEIKQNCAYNATGNFQQAQFNSLDNTDVHCNGAVLTNSSHANISVLSNQTQSIGVEKFESYSEITSQDNNDNVQYSLTVNNPATGNIKITCDQFPSEIRRSQDQGNEIIQSAKKNKQFQCEACDKSFNRRVHLQAHLRKHLSVKPFKCHVCNAQFKYANSLVSHHRLHEGLKPHKCSYCDAKFVQKSNLIAHERIHTGEKPYRCSVCELGFRQATHLRTHLITHTQVRPFKCTVCSKGFTQCSSLKRHMRTHKAKKEHSEPLSNEGSQPSCAVKVEQTSEQEEPKVCSGVETSNKKEVSETLSEKADENNREMNDSSLTESKHENTKVTSNSVHSTVNGTEAIINETQKRKGRKKDWKSLKQSEYKLKKLETALAISAPSVTVRSSARIKEAAIRKKSCPPKESEFITEIFDFDESDFNDFCDSAETTQSKNTKQLKQAQTVTVSDSVRPSGCVNTMGSWCFCEIPHAVDQPHTTGALSQSSETSLVASTANDLFFSDKHKKIKSHVLSSASADDTGKVSPTKPIDCRNLTLDATVKQHSYLSTGSCVSSSVDGSVVQLAESTSTEIIGYIGPRGQLIKTDLGQHGFTRKEITVAGNLVTLGDNETVNEYGEAHTDSNVIRINEQPNNLLSGATSASPTIGSTCYVSVKDISIGDTTLTYDLSRGEYHQNPLIMAMNSNGICEPETNSSQVVSMAATSLIEMQPLVAVAADDGYHGTAAVHLQSLASHENEHLHHRAHDAPDYKVQIINPNTTLNIVQQSAATVPLQNLFEDNMCESGKTELQSQAIPIQFSVLSSDMQNSREKYISSKATSSSTTEPLEASSSQVYELIRDKSCLSCGASQNASIVGLLESSAAQCPTQGSLEAQHSVAPASQNTSIKAAHISSISYSNEYYDHETLPKNNNKFIIYNENTRLAQSFNKSGEAVNNLKQMCQFCGLFFTDMNALVAHFRSEHQGKYMCSGCLKLLATEEELALHVCISADAAKKLDHSPKNLPSATGQNVIDSKAVPHVDSSKQQTEKNIDLPITTNTAKGVDVVVRPTNSKRSRTLAGKNVNDQTNDGSSMPRPRKSSARQHKFPCPYCKETFTSQCDVQRHALQHTGEKPHKCDQCDAAFTRRSSLNNHLRKHSGAKPYFCGACTASFSYRYQYNRHLTTNCVNNC